MITFTTFLWKGSRDYRPEHVNMLANAVRYFYPDPHSFVVFTDQPKGNYQPGVNVHPMPREMKALTSLPAPQGPNFPSSYARLWLFSEEAAEHLPGRVMLLDVDSLIVGDLRPLLDNQEDFVGWRPAKVWGKEKRIGGGTWSLETGSHHHLWRMFQRDPRGMIRKARELGWNGSDQAFMSHYFVDLDPGNWTIWPRECGIHGAQEGVWMWNYPPPGAKIVHCNGEEKHWGQDKLWMRAYNNAFRGPTDRTVDDFHCTAPCCNPGETDGHPEEQDIADTGNK